jgi:hypothetical protein
MRVRQVKFLAFDGRLADAAEAVRPMRRELLARHGVDLDDIRALAEVTALPPVFAPAGYLGGIVARDIDADVALAEARFAAAEHAARHHHRIHGRYKEPEVPRFEMEALGERALLVAPTDPLGARRLLRRLDAAATRSGEPQFAEAYRPRVLAALGPAPSATERVRATAGRYSAGARRRLRHLVRTG